MSSPRKSARPKKSPARRRGRIRISRVYTGAGDRGATMLVGGQSVPKDDPRIEACGAVDELGVWIGRARHQLALARESLPAPSGRARDPLDRLGDHLSYLQNLLFTLGGDLATRAEDRWPGMPVVQAKHVRYAERAIDAYNAALAPLTDFILAGGGAVALELHGCRVVARRAERRIQTLAAREPIGDRALPFVNRLSDLFFVLARWVAAEMARRGADEPESIWDRGLPPPPMPRPPRRAG